MQTGEIREDDSKGRHTTTHRQLIMLPCGAMIIDTPGMRELGMWDVTDGLDRTFADVESFLGQCRFSDCSHTKEPGCAVLSAIGRGELSQERWDNYQRLKREAKYSDDKGGYLLEKNQKFKSIAKAVKSMQNTNGKNKER
ncbi:putative ribosome biogenesis GTPase RsgA [bioreactor metagenome]|uniref:Putative ribosome biogenesis GTPase RsgA n=1 Tax=bioreactor metagenome TaxID=1076179 RepID=A0A645G323_9ZZZZ